jgi:hypothetical protein
MVHRNLWVEIYIPEATRVRKKAVDRTEVIELRLCRVKTTRTR